MYVQLSHCHPPIDSSTLKHGVGKCICMCLIDDLKLIIVEYDFTLHTKYSLYLYTQKENYPNKLPKPKSYLIP